MFKANTKDNRTSLLLTLNIFHIFFSVSEHLVQILSQPFEPILALCLYKKNLNRKLRYFHVANQWKLYIELTSNWDHHQLLWNHSCI